MKKLYILEVIYFGAVSIIAGLSPRLLSGWVTNKKNLDMVTFCSWIVWPAFALVALWFGFKGLKKYLVEKQRQKRLITSARI